MKVKEAPPTRSSLPQPWTERMRPARARRHCMQAWALVMGTLEQEAPSPSSHWPRAGSTSALRRAERRLLDEKEAG